MQNIVQNTVQNKILVDASIIVGIILEQRYSLKSLAYLENSEASFAVTTLTISLAWHFAEKFNKNFDYLKEFLGMLEILAIDEKTVEKAYEIWNENDFEDALQVAVCLENNCAILTTDKDLARKYRNLLDVELID